MKPPACCRRGAALAAVLCASVATARAQEAALDWRSVVGCYRMPSFRFALDSMPATFTMLSPVEGARQGWEYFFHGESAYWRVLPGDTVEYVQGNSLYGGRYHWVVRGDTLKGWVLPWSDVGPAARHPTRWMAYRESCAPDGSPGAPPPSARMLIDSVPAAVAAAVADSLLPRLDPALPLDVRYAGNPFSYSAQVAAILRRDPRARAAGASPFAVRLHVSDFTMERDSLSAVVVAWTCEDRARPNLHERRTRLRFGRAGSAWRLVAIEPAGESEGACAAELRATMPAAPE